jgi:hypothetical protein
LCNLSFLVHGTQMLALEIISSSSPHSNTVGPLVNVSV